MEQKGSRINSRELILDMLMRISAGEEYSHILIRNVLGKYDYLDIKEKAFMKRVTEGCLERRVELDYIVNAISKTPVNRMKPFIRELLRMSVYQLRYMDKVPDSAVINEAVKLAKKKGFQGLSGFVNGVLRNIARMDQIPYPDKRTDPMQYYSVRFSMPEWIVEKLIQDYGVERTEQILEGLLNVRPVTIRFPREIDAVERKQLLAQMGEQGISVKEHPYLEDAYSLSGLDGVAALPGFAEGRIAIQDVSSMLAIEAAGIQKGDACIDVCAAPGGKTAYAAMLTGEDGSVDSRDVSAYKTELIQENCDRLGLSNVTIRIQDATELDVDSIGKADVVIADVPCLGLGVMGRKRDIKYRVQKEDISSIVTLQRKILETVVSYVKPGGTLLYSTCSMTKEENEENVRWMEEHLDVNSDSMEEFLPDAFWKTLTEEEKENARDGFFQLFPGIHQTDGFFFARLKNKQES